MIIQQAVLNAMATKENEHALAITALHDDSNRELQRVQTALNYLTERVAELTSKTNTSGGGGNGGNNNKTDANKENNGNRKKRKNYGTWTPSIKFDKEWDGGKKGWFKYEQRQHKYKTDNALKKSDFPAWEKQKRAEMEKIIKSGKTE